MIISFVFGFDNHYYNFGSPDFGYDYNFGYFWYSGNFYCNHPFVYYCYNYHYGQYFNCSNFYFGPYYRLSFANFYYFVVYDYYANFGFGLCL